MMSKAPQVLLSVVFYTFLQLFLVDGSAVTAWRAIMLEVMLQVLGSPKQVGFQSQAVAVLSARVAAHPPLFS